MNRSPAAGLALPGHDIAKGRIRKISLVVIALFWILEFAELTLSSFVDDPEIARHAVGQRLLVAGLGFLLTLGLAEINIRTQGRTFRQRIAVALGIATIAALLLSGFNYLIFVIWMRVAPVVRSSDEVGILFDWSWFLFSFTGAILVISYLFELRQRDDSLAEARAMSRAAQLRALRYQLNPHFLFNTLNSIASLVRRRKNAAAETMVENLSDFLRSGLELDLHADVPLSREIELGQLYLGIESIRFPERLITAIDVPPGLQQAFVPSLITQPLLENALKYAVAESSTAVTVTISASIEGARLRISVTDEGSNASPSRPVHKSTGVGLANVAERLRVRFGENQSVRAQPTAAGGFSASIELPLRF